MANETCAVHHTKCTTWEKFVWCNKPHGDKFENVDLESKKLMTWLISKIYEFAEQSTLLIYKNFCWISILRGGGEVMSEQTWPHLGKTKIACHEW